MRSDWSYDTAFVIQLGPDTDFATGRLDGRIEHLASTRAARFRSLAELIAALRDLPGGDRSAGTCCDAAWPADAPHPD